MLASSGRSTTHGG
jgi:hypothetical protein